jgi:hypothetical protein
MMNYNADHFIRELRPTQARYLTGGKCGGKWRKHNPAESKGISKRELTMKQDGGDAKKLKMMQALQTVEDDPNGEHSTDDDEGPDDF